MQQGGVKQSFAAEGDAPVLRADISAKARDQARRSADEAGLWRLATGAGALTIALAFCAAVVQMLI
jgi:hypothetical protein